MTSAPVAASGIVIYRTLAAAAANSQAIVQYLLMHASYEKGLWTPPKGHQDPGEDLRQCAIRETEEECGLREEIHFRLIPEFSHSISYSAFGKPKSVTYYLGEVLSPDVPVKLSHEHNEFAWCSLDKAVELVRFKETVQVLQLADEYIRANTGK